MKNTTLTTLINGGNITRWSTLEQAMHQATRQPYYTSVLLGCDGRYWVPATPRVARQLMAAGYEEATPDRRLKAALQELEEAKSLYRDMAHQLAQAREDARTMRGELEELRRA